MSIIQWKKLPWIKSKIYQLEPKRVIKVIDIIEELKNSNNFSLIKAETKWILKDEWNCIQMYFQDKYDINFIKNNITNYANTIKRDN